MTFDSVYQMFTPLTIVRKQRFWDLFDGNALRSWWILEQINPTVTGAMVDAVDEGFSLTVGASSDEAQIHFADIRHYEPTGVVIQGVMRAVVVGSFVSFAITDDAFAGSSHRAAFEYDSGGDANFVLRTSNGSSSLVASSIARDTNWHIGKVAMNSSDGQLFMEGILEATTTSTLPTNKGQPAFDVFGRGASSQGRIRYIEAYNT